MPRRPTRDDEKYGPSEGGCNYCKAYVGVVPAPMVLLRKGRRLRVCETCYERWAAAHPERRKVDECR